MYLKTLVIFLVVFLSEYCDGEAPKNYFRYDYRYIERFDSFYKLHPRTTWLRAKRMCDFEGGSLFYPDDENEALEVISLLTNGTEGPPLFYVGMSDFMVKGVYDTVEGKPLIDVFNNWEQGEPTGYSSEHCVVLRSEGTTYRIRDETCKVKNHFICRKRQSTVEWNLSCDMPDPNYKRNLHTGNCYKFHKTPLNWPNAYAACRGEQSYLAVIDSCGEAFNLIALWQHFQETDITNQTVHVGYHNRLNEGWKTVKGDALSKTSSLWSLGHPTRENKMQCGAMLITEKLIDIDCRTKSAFICEHDVRVNRTATDVVTTSVPNERYSLLEEYDSYDN